MASICGTDPLVCIEFAAWGIGEFLKDWTTLALLTLLLALLFKLRVDQRKARELAYARQLEAMDDKRRREPREPTWQVGHGGAGDP